MTVLARGNLSSDNKNTPILIQDFKAGIDYTRLPRRFQDAIAISRRLGVRYLWIDSLCILQNCPNDWRRESAKTQHVYSNAYVTLAADGSRDSSGGLL